jgi:hypothetical protein
VLRDRVGVKGDEVATEFCVDAARHRHDRPAAPTSDDALDERVN